MRLAALILATCLALPAQAAEVTVFAAASLKTALDRIAADWQSATGNHAVLSYAGTPTLARQIEAGAPADVFLSASTAWMDTLAAEALVRADSRRDIVANSLVLVAHDRLAPAEISAELDLAALLAGGKLSMAMVTSVPAGQYGKQALISLGLWDAVQASIVQSENVRAALQLVALGEAPLGIVYASDAVAEPAVTVVGTFPADSHSPIRYPGAVVATSTAPQAQQFLDYLMTDAARAVFAGQGFTMPD